MNSLKYRQPDPHEADMLLDISRTGIGMTDVYTYIRLHPELPQDARLWLAEKDGIRSVIYDDGAYFTFNGITDKKFIAAKTVKGESLFKSPKEKHRLVLMEYRGMYEDEASRTVPIAGKAVLDVFRLMSSCERLPEYLEKRYVDTVRGINAGLCTYRGIYDNGVLAACGGTVASNEKYALIGNIFTKEGYRGRHFASDTVKALANDAIKKGLIPVLYCEKEMTGFYEARGFHHVKL